MAWTQTQYALLQERLRSLAPSLGTLLAQQAFAHGLAVTDATTGLRKPIPLAMTPVVLAGAELTRRQRGAALLASAGLKMATAMMAGLRSNLIVDGLSPLEKSFAERTFRKLTTLVNTRVDFFVGDTVKALEINATIPAMQGYSDIAADTFLDTVSRHWGAGATDVARLKQRNGSNALALLQALRTGYAQEQKAEPKRIALLCRRNDAQLTEQLFLAEAFTKGGIDAEVVFPDQLRLTDVVEANGQTYDLVYRHIFIRRLEEAHFAGAEAVKRLLDNPSAHRAVVLNMPATHVEAKCVFALLSESLDNAQLHQQAGLTAQELEAINEMVPWTRVFEGGALVKKVQEDPGRYVLKRSWDYGGRAVFVGATADTPGFTERTTVAFGKPLTWPETCAAAAADTRGGGFVVQEMVRTQSQSHLICTEAGAQPTELYVDFSSYASVGVESQPHWGGVCRGSVSPIVNIVGGGGVLPLITEEVAELLLKLSKS
jgi:hypothetical protein